MVQEAEFVRMRVQLGRVFTPNAPVSHKDSLQGRVGEIVRVIDAVAATGAHAVILGERGVGKTSLAGLVQELWSDRVKESHILVARVNCEPLDDYIDIWAHVAEDLLARGIEEESREFVAMLERMADGEASAAFVRRCFQACASLVVVIIDEFDRVLDSETRQHFADAIKGLSDYGVDTTLVLVGVADTLGELIANHASVDRNLRQIVLPRLLDEEVGELVTSRYAQIGMEYEARAVEFIVRLAQGLPYYAHLIGQTSGLAAVVGGRRVVSESDVLDGLNLATQATEESVRRNYHDAVASPRRDSIHPQVVLACALAERDQFGYFTAASVRGPLARILGRTVEMQRYLKYLSDLSTESRGSLLRQEGRRWSHKYRFNDPLLESYVILKALEEGTLTPEALRESPGDS